MSRGGASRSGPRLAAAVGLLCCGAWAAAAGQAGPEPVATTSLGVVDARGAALLLSGQSGGAVEGALLWTTRGAVGEGEPAEVTVLVEVDGSALLEGSTGLPVPIEIYGYLLDDAGAVVGHLAEGLMLDDLRRLEAVRGSGLKFIGAIRAPAGLYSLRVVVRNRDTRRFFLARRDLEVPGGAPGRPYVLPPLVAEPGGRWVVARQHGLGPGPAPGGAEGAEPWPAAVPSWLSHEPLEVVIGHGGPGAERRLSVQLLDPAGAPVAEPELEMGAEIETAGELVFQHATVAAPDLPPGEYLLRVVASDAESGESAAQAVPVLVFEGLETRAWTDEAAPRAHGDRALPVRAAAAPDELEDEAMRAAYAGALSLWARGDPVGARRRLAELERPPAGGDPSRRWRRLFTLERLTLLALAEQHPAALMGAAVLHRDMYGWYMARRETDLAEHSWQMAAMIARMAPAVDGLEPPPGFSECLLLDLATRLAGAGDLKSARRALEVAAEVAPESAAARLGLGALHERTGQPMEAAAELQQLVDAHPDRAEGRLRLAVNRARLGGEKTAEELFRSLLEPPAPLWVRTLAYQELGRLLIADGRAAEAARLLREGVGQIPDNQRLRILELRALDLAGRAQEAAAAVDRLEPRLSQQSTSPRYLYSRWPDLDRDRVRETLAVAEAAGVAALQEALP